MNYNLDNRSMLKKVSDPWIFGQEDSQRIKHLMLSLMKQNNGIGLAANQIGLNKQIFAMGAENHQEMPKPFILFNPKIIEHKGNKHKAVEGCLSYPNLWLEIERYNNLLVEYQDENGNFHNLELFDLASKCFQHELEHLSGICFIDKVSRLKLQLAMKKLRKLQ